jgi:hypothetical protein
VVEDEERRRESASFGEEAEEAAVEMRWTKEASSPSSRVAGGRGMGWSGSGSKSLWSEGEGEVERRRWWDDRRRRRWER